MGIRRRLLRELLNSLKYIKNLTEKQICASLWRGETRLSDLELEPRHLQQLLHDSFPCGLEILEATVKEVSVTIPWSKIMTQSIVVHCKDVEVKVAVHCGDDEDWKEIVSGIHRKYLNGWVKRIDNAPFSLTSSAAGAFDQVRARMMDGMSVHISSASMSMVSSHPRHFPSHGPLSGDSVPSDEVLRIVGEDIVLRPADIKHKPCEKLKHMCTYDGVQRVLQLTKFLKCQSFRVLPGRCKNDCPHAAAEYMRNPTVFTCAMTTRYPSDGSRICPFIINSELFFDFPNALEVSGCECQLRAFTAVVGDVGMLEGWRLNPTVLQMSATSTSVAPSAAQHPPSEPPLQDTSSIARTFARGADWKKQAPSLAIDAEGASTTPAVPGTPTSSTPVAPSTPTANIGGGTLLTRQTSPSSPAVPTLTSPQPCALTQRTDCSAATTPRSLTSATPPQALGTGHMAAPASGGVVGSSNASEMQLLADTSSMARAYAQGQPSKKSSVASSGLWKYVWPKIHKPPPSPSNAPGAAGMSTAPSCASSSTAVGVGCHGAEGKPVQSSSLTQQSFPLLPPGAVSPRGADADDSDEFDDAVQSPVRGASDSQIDFSIDAMQPQDPVQSVEAEAAATVESSQVGSLTSAIPDKADLHGAKPRSLSEDARQMTSDDSPKEHDSDDDDDEEDDDAEDFKDAEDYYSVGSADSGAGAEAAAEDLSSEQQSWLKPMFKWWGGKTPAQTEQGEWPEMKTVAKRMGIAVSDLVARMTIVDDSAPASGSNPSVGLAELRLDAMTWRSDTKYSLPGPHLECAGRLKRVEEAKAVASASASGRVGPWCLPVLLDGAQIMSWPRAAVRVQMHDSENKDEVVIMESRDGGPKVPDGSMVSIWWKPRDAPATLVEQTVKDGGPRGLSQQLRSWPMHVKLHNARLLMDSARWMFARRCQERCKPFLLSKRPAPPLLPLVLPDASSGHAADGTCAAGPAAQEEVFPVEAFAMEFEDCEFLEPYSERTLRQERRWPMRVRVPRTSMRSHSELWEFASAFKERGLDILAPAGPETFVETSGPAGSDDVTIPKEMFDDLVRCKSEATLKESQVVAAREELQKAYIALASVRAASAGQGSSDVQEMVAHPSGYPSSVTGAKPAKSGASSWSSTFTGVLWGGGLSSLLPSASGDHHAATAGGGAATTSVPVVSASASMTNTPVAPGGVGASTQPASADAAAILETTSPAGGPVAASSTTTVEAPNVSRATSPRTGGGGGGASGDAQAVASSAPTTEEEMEKLRRRCAQLESSLASQVLAQRRLESELAHYQALARNELRQVLCAKAHLPCEVEK